jgi:hypothetical protein
MNDKQLIKALKHKARKLMRPWLIRRENYDCGMALLQHICPTQWADYRKGCAYARLARMKEKQHERRKHEHNGYSD